MKYPVSETFYKDGILYYVESQHVDGCNSYHCIEAAPSPFADYPDETFLTKEDIEFYANKG